MKKIFLILTIIIILGIGAGGYLYYTGGLDQIFTGIGTGEDVSSTGASSRFNPFRRSAIPAGNTTTNTPTPVIDDTTATTTPVATPKIPRLRHLSESPIGGMGASTTASTTVVRYIDRGTGHIYESKMDQLNIDKISNTTISRVYRSFWNKNLTSTVLQYIKDGSDDITTFTGTLRMLTPAQNTSTSTSGSATGTTTASTVSYDLRGRFLSPDIQSIAVSPRGDRIFTWLTEGGRGTGYISNFDESNLVKIIDVPFTEVNIDWPAENILTITTKGTSYGTGIMYSADPTKTSAGGANLKKVLSGVKGLSALMSRDGSKVLYTGSSGTNSIKTSLLNTKDNSIQEVIFKTMPEKCVWSALRKNELYCAVPTEIPNAKYPDSWYQSTISFVDRLWHLDTDTGEVHLLAKLLEETGDIIDATDLTLDPKENFLYFVNKNDLTLWSLDLNE